jgi:hypothetical protein
MANSYLVFTLEFCNASEILIPRGDISHEIEIIHAHSLLFGDTRLYFIFI